MAEVLADRLVLPSTEVMSASITRDDEVRQRDFDPRWGILWDRLPYIRSLEMETRRASGARHLATCSSADRAVTPTPLLGGVGIALSSANGLEGRLAARLGATSQDLALGQHAH